MNTVTYSNFNENSKYYLENLVKSNEEIIILKNKKPAFRIIPVNTNKPANILKDSIVFEEDIVSPTNENWEVG